MHMEARAAQVPAEMAQIPSPAGAAPSLDFRFSLHFMSLVESPKTWAKARKATKSRLPAPAGAPMSTSLSTGTVDTNHGQVTSLKTTKVPAVVSAVNTPLSVIEPQSASAFQVTLPGTALPNSSRASALNCVPSRTASVKLGAVISYEAAEPGSTLTASAMTDVSSPPGPDTLSVTLYVPAIVYS